MKKEKILYIHNADFTGMGANKIQVISMCSAFNEIDIETTLLGFGDGERNVRKRFELKKGIKLLILKKEKNYYLRSLKLFRKVKSIKNSCENILTRDLLCSYLIKRKFPSKKVFYELHDLSNGKVWNSVFKKTFKIIDKVIVISEGLKEGLIKKGFDKKKIVVLHDGVDIKKFDIKISQKDARKKLSLPLNKKIVLYAGLFDEWKGYKTVLKASNSNEDEKLCFVLYGATKEQITNLSDDYPKAVIKEFISYNKLPIVLKSADALLIPNSGKEKISSQYTSPLKLFAYMVSKRPIICSNLPSMKRVLSDKEAVFFKADDHKDMLKKATNLLKNNTKSKTLAKNAFSKVKNYDWKNRANNINIIFNKN